MRRQKVTQKYIVAEVHPLKQGLKQKFIVNKNVGAMRLQRYIH